MEQREVRIGDRAVRVESLSGWKVLRAGKSVARIAKQVGNVSSEIQEFISNYRAANTEVMTRARFEYRRGVQEAAVIANRREVLMDQDPEPSSEAIESELEALRMQLRANRLEISDEAWERSDNEITISQDPSPQEIGAYLLPILVDSAEEEVVRLLALVVAPDVELREARRNGVEAYEAYLNEKGEDLLFDGEIDQLLDLAVIVAEVLSQKLRGKARRLRAAWERLTGASLTSTETDDDSEKETETSSESSSSTSSIPSDLPTDGEPTSPSSPSGTTSPVSSSA
jgi:hypothetical protein